MIYDLKIDKAYCLNETSALVWNLCDGNNSVTNISEKLTNQTKSPVSEDLVWFALDQLKKDNLLENGQHLISPFVGVTRREAVKKVGFASLIAIPVVMSLHAPASAAAASNCLHVGGCPGNGGGGMNVPIGCGCTTNADCAPPLTCMAVARADGSPGTALTCCP